MSVIILFFNASMYCCYRGSMKLVSLRCQYWGEIRNFFSVCVFRIFRTIARCSKYDFWNLWEIWDRNRYSKKFWSTKQSSKKIRKLLVEKHFGTKKFRAPISMPNDPKIPKIILRTAYGHYKITNSVHEKKLLFFCSI